MMWAGLVGHENKLAPEAMRFLNICDFTPFTPIREMATVPEDKIESGLSEWQFEDSEGKTSRPKMGM